MSTIGDRGPRIIAQNRRREGMNVAHGETDVTTCPMAIYVDPVNGDDGGMVGDESRPFRSLARALERVPRTIAHDVKIVLLSTGEHGDIASDVTIEREVCGARLILVGRGIEEAHTYMGGEETYLIESSEELPNGSWKYTALGNDLPGENDGWWLMGSGDLHYHAAIPLISFAANPTPEFFDFCVDSARLAIGLQNGESFRIVRPSPTLIARKLTIVLTDTAPDPSSDLAGAPLVLLNLSVKLEQVGQYHVVRGSGARMGLSAAFVRFVLAPLGGGGGEV